MAKIKLINTYHFVADLEDKVLAEAKTLEEQIIVLMHFRDIRDAVFQREWESFNTAA